MIDDDFWEVRLVAVATLGKLEPAVLAPHAPAIVAKLEDPTVMESFDETSRVRIFRGMITNNNGTDEENVQEAIRPTVRSGNGSGSTRPSSARNYRRKSY